MPLYIQWYTYKNHLRPLSTKPEGQDSMEQYISSPERKWLTVKNTISRKVILSSMEK
jgi:hypothetical protein